LWHPKRQQWRDGIYVLLCLPLLSASKYWFAGQMMQRSVQHGGPGMPVLSRQQYQFLINDNAHVATQNVSMLDHMITEMLRDVSTLFPIITITVKRES